MNTTQGSILQNINLTASHYLLVGAGGGLGAMARFAVGAYVIHYFTNIRFPLGTFIVNIAGCLFIGIFAALSQRYEFVPGMKFFLITGFLGGFTTFSAFGLETFVMLRRGDFWLAGTNAVVSVLLGLAAVWIGFRLFHQVQP